MLLQRFLLLLGLIYCSAVRAQLNPAPGDTLNFTQIMFEHPAIKEVEYYKLQIIERGKDSLFRHPLIEITDSAPAVLIDKFEFGKKYLWRYTAVSKGKNTRWEGPYSFEVMNEDSLNKHRFRIFVLQNDKGINMGGLILLDCNTVAYDRTGKAVWYLHFNVTKPGANPPVRDLRISNAGTVTYLFGKDAIESNLKGKELWRAPQRDADMDERPVARRELYHHDFKRLDNGDYMVLAGLVTNRKLPAYIDTSKINRGSKPNARPFYIKNIDGSLHATVSIGTIVEFDKAGKIVWQWNSNNYFTDEDLFPRGTDLGQPLEERDTHLNAFSVDEQNKFVYAGFRNISRIIKIDKQTGKVVYSWGNKSLSGEAGDGRGFFWRQHDAHILADGSIAVFNNNIPEVKTSSVVIFSQHEGKDSSKIIWTLDCNLDSVVKAKSMVGGNVDELPNKNLLICTGNSDRIFEITRDKQMVWHAIGGRKTINDTSATPYPLYRAHYVSSLYPCYFALQQIKEANAGELRFKIFNTGTEKDIYEVANEDHEDGHTSRTETAEVPAGSWLIYTPEQRHAGSAEGAIKISVRSKKNPDLVKYIELTAE
jgi:hypothetical protein